MPVQMPRPWRSVRLPRVAVVIALALGLPLYLRSPVWCDVTLYEVAAQNLLDGGIHYRDVFDTNLPGFVWLLTGLRWLSGHGPNPLLIRLADLVVIACVVALIDRLAKWGGATCASRWWTIAAVAFFYPFAIEMIHAQRDVWMALPALAAVVLRVRRTRNLANTQPPPSDPGSACFANNRRVFLPALLEGALWGMAVWIKPHVVLVAAVTWLFTTPRLVAERCRPGSSAIVDLLGNLCGGSIVGGLGVVWLIGTGTWEHFWNVVTVWQPMYAELPVMKFWGEEFWKRANRELFWFPPWSLWIIPTIPLALLSLIDAVPWRGRSARDCQAGPIGRLFPWWLWEEEADSASRIVRGILAAVYLAWVAQAFFIQREHAYAHVPETLLMFGLWAAHRWAFPVVFVLLWVLLTSGTWMIGDCIPVVRESLLTIANDKKLSAVGGEARYLVRHPLSDWERMGLWGECWRLNQTEHEKYKLWDGLRRMHDDEATIDWEQMEQVAEFLREEGVKDGDRDGKVIAWHDSPHVIYLMLNLKPGYRFMHVCTIESLMKDGFGMGQLQKALTAVEGKARYAIADLEWAAINALPSEREVLLLPPLIPGDLLPKDLNCLRRSSFPYNQPVMFRTRDKTGLENSGRYTVHKLTPPLKAPEWRIAPGARVPGVP